MVMAMNSISSKAPLMGSWVRTAWPVTLPGIFSSLSRRAISSSN